MLFKHLNKIINSQKISKRSTLTPEVVVNLVNSFHAKNFSAYKGRGEFVPIGNLVLERDGRETMTVEVKIDPKSEFVFADFLFEDLQLCPEVWQYTGGTCFDSFRIVKEKNWFDEFLKTLLTDLERAVA